MESHNIPKTLCKSLNTGRLIRKIPLFIPGFCCCWQDGSNFSPDYTLDGFFNDTLKSVIALITTYTPSVKVLLLQKGHEWKM